MKRQSILLAFKFHFHDCGFENAKQTVTFVADSVCSSVVEHPDFIGRDQGHSLQTK